MKHSFLSRAGGAVAAAVLCAACAQSAPAATTDTAPAASAPAATSTATAATAAATTAPAAASTATAAAETTADGVEPILIGLAVAQSGPAAALGSEQIAGAQIAEEWVNAYGKVNGRPIKLVIEDTGENADSANAAMQRLISNDKIVGVVGPTLSEQLRASAPLADEHGIALLASNSEAGVPELGTFVARVAPPVHGMETSLIKAALRLRPVLKRVAVLYTEADPISAEEAARFQYTITDTYGLELAAVATYDDEAASFDQQITQVIDAKPDLVVVSGPMAAGGALVRGLREGGYDGPMIGGNGLSSAEAMQACKDACDTLLVTLAYNYKDDSQMNKTFRTAYQARFDRNPSQLSAQAFTAVQMFVESLRKIDAKQELISFDSNALRTKLNETLLGTMYVTPMGRLTFSPEGELLDSQFYVGLMIKGDNNALGSIVPFDTNRRR